MSLTARPYLCRVCGTESWVSGDKVVYCCPCCDSNELEYHEEDTPIFVLLVEDIRGALLEDGTRDGGYIGAENLTLRQCIEIGQEYPTDWELLNALVDAKPQGEPVES